MAGLSYVQDQTFGVEIEFTSPYGSPDHTGLVYPSEGFMRVAHTLLRTIERVASLPVDRTPRNYHRVADTRCWRVEFDRSAGWEVVSPILSNQRGFTELTNVLKALHGLLHKSSDLHINYRTGLHLTLGSPFTEDRQVAGLVRLVQVLEPGLFTLVSPSRLYRFGQGAYDLTHHNRYAEPLRKLPLDSNTLGLGSFSEAIPSHRYRTLNLCDLGRDDPHLEVRMHNGTTEYAVVLPWISLWMTLLQHARRHGPSVGSTEPIFPGGNVVISPEQARAEDVFALLDRLQIPIEPRLRSLLVRRRTQLLERWKKVIPQRVHAWRRGWWSDGRPERAEGLSVSSGRA